MFDQSIADVYDSFFDTRLGAFLDDAETRCAFDLLKPTGEDSILDVGCGTGAFTFKLVERGSRVTGVDLSDAMLGVARRRASQLEVEAQKRVSFHAMDAGVLTFADNTFDAAMTMATLSFVEDPERVFREMMRVVRPGGRVVVGVINRASAWGEFYRALAEQGDPVFSQASLLTADQLRGWDVENLAGVQGCLYLPPDTAEPEITWETEQRCAATEAPGFCVARWNVPATS